MVASALVENKAVLHETIQLVAVGMVGVAQSRSESTKRDTGDVTVLLPT
jgi:hypothetical protein